MHLVALMSLVLACATCQPVNHCNGCLEPLFQTSDTPIVGESNVPLQLTASDAGKLVAVQINDMKFKDVLEKTIPETNDLNEIYSTSTLDYDIVLKKMKLSIGKVVSELVPSPTYKTLDEITDEIANQVSQLKLHKTVKERNQNLVQKREMILDQTVHSMINDMWTITSNKIREVELDTHNVSKSLYGQMVKDLLSELSQATNISSVQTRLAFPVITDELNLIIRKNNDTGTVYELTDKIFDKLTPFIREGLLMELTPLDTKAHKEDIAEDIKIAFGPYIEMSTKDGLIVAGKTQKILNEELEHNEFATKFIDNIKPYLSEGVEVGMNHFKSKKRCTQGCGGSQGYHKDAYTKQWLANYILKDINWSTKKDLFQHYSKSSFAKVLEKETSSEKMYPEDIEVIDIYMTQVILPKMKEFMFQEIDEFRRQNPQLSKCGTKIVAATVYGSVAMKVVSLTKEYVESMGESEVNKQAAFNFVLQKLNDSLLKKIEQAGEDYDDFAPEKFKQSQAFNDVEAELKSKIQSLVMKQSS